MEKEVTYFSKNQVYELLILYIIAPNKQLNKKRKKTKKKTNKTTRNQFKVCLSPCGKKMLFFFQCFTE